MPRSARATTALLAASMLMAGAGLVACGDQLEPSSATRSTGPAAQPVEAAATERVRIPSSGGSLSVVTDVRLRAEGGYDRFVIELDTEVDELPGIDIQYVDSPTSSDGPDGTDAPVEVAGEKFLQVKLDGASRTDPEATADAAAPAAPTALPGRSVVTEAVQVSDTGSELTWVLGMPGEQPFAMSTEASPTRIVIDVVATSEEEPAE